MKKIGKKFLKGYWKKKENDSHKELSEKVNDLDEKITLQNQTITKENKIKK